MHFLMINVLNVQEAKTIVPIHIIKISFSIFYGLYALCLLDVL